MAALTWRNVDAPNFAPALQGFEQFSRMLNQGLSGAQIALGAYDQTKTDEVSNEFIQNLLTRYAGSPDQLNADMQSGALFEGVDRRRLNGDALELLGRRPQDLLTYATGAQRLDDATQDTAYEGVVRGWETQDRDALVAARPQVARLLAAANASDNPEQAIAAIQSSPEYLAAIGNLNPDLQAQIAKAPIDQVQGLLDLVGTRIDNRGGELDNVGKGISNETATFNLETGRWEHNNAVVDRRDQQMGMALGSRVLSGSNSAESALVTLENDPEFQRASPMAQSVARGIVAEQYGNIYAPSPAAALTEAASGGMGNTGDYDSFVIALESGGDPNARAGTSSATGLHQFTDQTWLGTVEQARPAWARGMSRAQILAQRTNPARSAEMERVLRSQNIAALSEIGAPPTNENVYAMHHFGNARGIAFARAGANTPMSEILTPAQINANPYLRNLTKGQAIQNWNRRAGVASGGVNPRISAAVTTSQINNNSGTSRWMQNLSDESNAPEVARSLRGTSDAPGPLQNVPEAWISEQVRNIVRRGTRNGVQHITYAEAGRILADTTSRQQRGVLDRLISLDFNDTNLGNGYSTDNDAIEARIEEAVRGVPQQRAEAMETVGASAAAIETARSQVAAAQAEYDAMIRSGRPAVIAANRDRLMARLNAARQNLIMVQGAAAPNIVPSTVNPDEESFSFSDLFRVRTR